MSSAAARALKRTNPPFPQARNQGWRVLVGLLVIATLVANATFATAAEPFPHWSAAAFLGVALGQIVAMTGWLVVGRSSLFLRAASFAVTTIGLAAALDAKLQPSASELLGVLLLTAFGAAVPLMVLRWSGFPGAAIERADSARGSDKPSLKFSLAQLFGVTTAAAIFAALSRLVRFPTHFPADAAVACMVFAVAGVVPLVAFLGLRARRKRMLPLTIISLNLMALISYGEAAPYWAPIVGFQWAFLYTVAYVLRDCEPQVA